MIKPFYYCTPFVKATVLICKNILTFYPITAKIIGQRGKLFMSIFQSIGNFFAGLTPATVFPFITGLFLLLFFAYYIKILRPLPGTTEWIKRDVQKASLTFLNRRHPMKSRDIAPLVIIITVFSILAVYNLGDSNPVNVMQEIESPSADRNHMNNMYFDEIYFVRTAVEHIESIIPYEISHPPLGKELIAASILFFGMSPFGWRLGGALLGVVILLIIYVFIKNMFGRTIIATCGTLLLGFDFMRFVQTRIATIDTFAVLFILLAFFFMYRHITTHPNAPFRKSVAPLALSGLFFGLSFATKWIGFYAGAGLLIIYTIRLFQLGFHYSHNKKHNFSGYLMKTLLCSLLFFVIIPAIIYYLTYIPYGTARGMALSRGMLWNPEFFRIVWNNQIVMYRYHSQLVAEHPFSSVWWQWIFNIRPILYVNGIQGDLRATFGSFGNPVVWWGGFIAIIMMAVRVFTHRDGKALFILFGYLSQLLPWVAVTRILFAYHYFPSTLFLVLALAHIFNTFIERLKKPGNMAAVGYTSASGLLFAIFYPSLSGMHMPNWYYSNILRWFYTWPF